ncbi:hypothetical protein [Georgenia satyanarayanai]|uniref:hypothetical protein n=1 Tax=Georgenia satyanarayanai TaxID=860221 RepID=UPI001264F1D5|nr:hypothetical protein [Georgenia satyanarayanai]
MGYDTSGGTVTGVELSCFQNDTLTFYVEVMRESGPTYSLDGTEVDVTCVDGAHTEEVDTTGADSVRIGVSGAENQGAWSAVFLGE